MMDTLNAGDKTPEFSAKDHTTQVLNLFIVYSITNG